MLQGQQVFPSPSLLCVTKKPSKQTEASICEPCHLYISSRIKCHLWVLYLPLHFRMVGGYQEQNLIAAHSAASSQTFFPQICTHLNVLMLSLAQATASMDRTRIKAPCSLLVRCFSRLARSRSDALSSPCQRMRRARPCLTRSHRQEGRRGMASALASDSWETWIAAASWRWRGSLAGRQLDPSRQTEGQGHSLQTTRAGGCAVKVTVALVGRKGRLKLEEMQNEGKRLG